MIVSEINRNILESHRRLKRKVNNKINLFPIDLKSDYRKSVLVCGSARSGTTWLANIINYDDKFRFMFEPYHIKLIEIVKHFKTRQYIRPGDKNPDFVEPTDLILRGKLKHYWVDRYNRRLISAKRLIKCVRANLFLKWVKSLYPEIPVVLVIRHPLAVAFSRMRLTEYKDWDWNVDFSDCLGQPDLMQDHLEPFRKIMSDVSTPYEKHIISWCITNYVPLRQFDSGQIHIVFYENLCMHPEKELERLFSFLSQPYDERVLAVWEKMSPLAMGHRDSDKSDNPVTKWKNNLSPEQVRQGVKLLEVFGLEKLYSDEPMPLVQNADSFVDSFQ